jgi:simple sugar transport system ATP-binding protein
MALSAPDPSQTIRELRMVDIVKRFPGVLANDRVSFSVHAGQIHALLGENGAGKSTLMRQLYGLYRPDEGQIVINGEPREFHSPADAIGAGIGMVHQHFMLVGTLTVAENVALGLAPERGPVLEIEQVAARCRELSRQYSLKVDPDAYIWQLAVGEQQRVEILKALYRKASLLVLDEPTAVLTPQEVEELFITLRQMAGSGHSVIFISHKLHEVLAVSERVTILRDGRTIGTYPTAQMSKVELARLMVGRDVVMQYDRTEVPAGTPRLEVQNLWVEGDGGSPTVRGVSLDVRASEILGIAGVSGNGQRELAEALAGLRPVQQGQVRLDGKEITNSSPRQNMAQGLAYIPEERMRHGVIGNFSVAENLILRDHGVTPFVRGMFLAEDRIRRHARALIESYQIRTPSEETPVKNLSGGNIQKLILARELSRKPSVLIAAQPTRGVDIGATEYIHRQLLEQRATGTATIVISEDLDEIRAISDRIAVMYEGELMGVVERGTATTEELGLMMAGVRPAA